MILKIKHQTNYYYSSCVPRLVQSLKLFPSKSKNQKVGLNVVEAYLRNIQAFLTTEELIVQKKYFILVDPPKMAVFKTKPKLPLIIIIGAFTGLFLGCTSVLLFDRIQNIKAAYANKNNSSIKELNEKAS